MKLFTRWYINGVGDIKNIDNEKWTKKDEKMGDGNIGINLGILALAYIVIPVITGLIVNTLCLKFKIYSPEVFKFQSGE